MEQTIISWEEDDVILSYTKRLVISKSEISAVDKLVNVINPKAKEIIKRKYIDMETVESIAESLELSESTINRTIKNTFTTLDRISEYL